MGITVAFYRISAAQFAQAQQTQNDDAVEAVMRQHRDPFPYSLHYLELEKISALLDGFLNPTDDQTSIFWQVLNGGRTITGAMPRTSGDVYLNVCYYFDPPLVTQISRAMAAIRDYYDILPRYKTMLGFATDKEALENTGFPTYSDMRELFRDTFCFFHIAEEVGDVIVRYHNG